MNHITSKKHIISLFILLLFCTPIQGEITQNIHTTTFNQNNEIPTCSDAYCFNSESNASIYIVTVESNKTITLPQGKYIITLKSNGTHITTGSDYCGCFVVNDTVIDGIGSVGRSESVTIGKLRYIHLQLNDAVNYSYDNRTYYTYNHTDRLAEKHIGFRNISFPPGKWHFIFYGVCFGIPQDEILYHYKVSLNFSNDEQELSISTSEGGRAYGLSFTEYDANLIFSKSWTVECMLDGKADFQINNTFVYEFVGHPMKWGANSIWNVVWNTPQGKKNIFVTMLNKKLYCNKNKIKGTLWDVGASGSYSLQTSYFAYDPTNKGLAWTPFFVGLDVKLP